MEEESYPALYQAANSASLKAQNVHLVRVRLFSLLLIVGAGLGVYGIDNQVSAIAAAIIITTSIFISVWMLLKKDEDSWYRARALAESVKTSCWRFMMRSEPYQDIPSIQSVKVLFRDRLKNLLNEHKGLSIQLGGNVSQQEQITDDMCNIRELNLDERKAFYLTHRIDEQRRWYAKKSSYNINQSKLWFVVLISCQIAAVFLAIVRVAYPDWKYIPTEIFLVAAGSALTWIQVKKFRELGSAYSLTAHEIGLIRGEIQDADDEAKFAQFVIDSESAFSREHTQWLARKDMA